jgi:hypothetical protein
MVSRQSMAAEAGVPYQNIQCGIWGGLTGTATGVSSWTLAFPCHHSANGVYSCVYRQHYTFVTLVTSLNNTINLVFVSNFGGNSDRFLKLNSWWLVIKLCISVKVCEEVYPLRQLQFYFKRRISFLAKFMTMETPLQFFWSYSSYGLSVLEVNCGSRK